MSNKIIHFHHEIENFSLENEDAISKWLIDVTISEKKELASLNYIFCSDEYLLDINKKYLDHDYYTDIISFPMKSDPVEGDIFISIDRVKDNALQFQTAFKNELHRVMVHGLLHFLGYDDHEEEDVKVMREKEDHYLKLI